MKLLPIGRGEITLGQLGFSVVPVIRGIMTAPSRAGSRARTKTAACGAANRGFESHPARQLTLSRKESHFELLPSVVRYYRRFFRTPCEKPSEIIRDARVSMRSCSRRQ